VYVSPTDLGYETIIDGWILTRRTKLNRNEEADKLKPIL
jgi:hypothetical protein